MWSKKNSQRIIAFSLIGLALIRLIPTVLGLVINKLREHQGQNSNHGALLIQTLILWLLSDECSTQSKIAIGFRWATWEKGTWKALQTKLDYVHQKQHDDFIFLHTRGGIWMALEA